GIDHHFAPTPALRRVRSHIGRNAHGRVPAADRSECYERIAVAGTRYPHRPRSERHDVLEVAVEGGDASHQRMPRIETAQREWGAEDQVRRIIVRMLIPSRPPAVDSVRLGGPIMAKPVLDDYPASIHVVRQAVAEGRPVREWRIVERNTDVVVLKLSEGGGA